MVTEQEPITLREWQMLMALALAIGMVEAADRYMEWQLNRKYQTGKYDDVWVQELFAEVDPVKQRGLDAWHNAATAYNQAFRIGGEDG